jgi:hypothetical protein
MGSFLIWITVITFVVWVSSAAWYSDRFGMGKGPMPMWMRNSLMWIGTIVIIAWTLWNGKQGKTSYP